MQHKATFFSAAKSYGTIYTYASYD